MTEKVRKLIHSLLAAGEPLWDKLSCVLNNHFKIEGKLAFLPKNRLCFPKHFEFTIDSSWLRTIPDISLPFHQEDCCSYTFSCKLHNSFSTEPHRILD